MTAIHPFHRVVAATVRAAAAPTVVAPVSGAVAPWLRYRCGTAAAAPSANRAGTERRVDAGPVSVA